MLLEVNVRIHLSRHNCLLPTGVEDSQECKACGDPSCCAPLDSKESCLVRLMTPFKGSRRKTVGLPLQIPHRGTCRRMLWNKGKTWTLWEERMSVSRRRNKTSADMALRNRQGNTVGRLHGSCPHVGLGLIYYLKLKILIDVTVDWHMIWRASFYTLPNSPQC